MVWRMPEDNGVIDGGVRSEGWRGSGAAMGSWQTDAGSLCPPGSGIECQFL